MKWINYVVGSLAIVAGGVLYAVGMDGAALITLGTGFLAGDRVRASAERAKLGNGRAR